MYSVFEKQASAKKMTKIAEIIPAKWTSTGVSIDNIVVSWLSLPEPININGSSFIFRLFFLIFQDSNWYLF